MGPMDGGGVLTISDGSNGSQTFQLVHDVFLGFCGSRLVHMGQFEIKWTKVGNVMSLKYYPLSF